MTEPGDVVVCGFDRPVPQPLHSLPPVRSWSASGAHCVVVLDTPRGGEARALGMSQFTASTEGFEGALVSASMGRAHAAVATDRGELFQATRANVGDRDDNYTSFPILTRVALEQQVTQVACGSLHVVALALDGQVLTWGDNSKGQLGHGDREAREAPTAVFALADCAPGGATQVAAGVAHTLAVTAAGRVAGWGWNADGQLALEQTDCQSAPALLAGGGLEAASVSAVAAGAGHSLALTTDGHVFSWGLDSDGQLGRGVDSFAEDYVSSLPFLGAATPSGRQRRAHVPARVALLDDKRVQGVAAGHYHSAAVTAAGFAYTWGRNAACQLGHRDSAREQAPRKLTWLRHRARGVLAGAQSTAIVCEAEPVLRVAPSSWAAELRAGLLEDNEDHADAVFALPDGWRVRAHKIVLHGRAPALFALAESAGDGGVAQLDDGVEAVGARLALELLYTGEARVPEGVDADDALEATQRAAALLDVPGRDAQLDRERGLIRDRNEYGGRSAMRTLFNTAQAADEGHWARGDVELLPTAEGDFGSVHAHRAVLAARCAPLRALFEGGFADAHAARVPVEGGYSTAALRAFVGYLYHDDEELDDQECVVEVMALANQFGLPRLVQICEQTIEQVLDSGSVLWLLEAADLHGADQLRALCVYRVLNDYGTYGASEEFTQLPERLQVELAEKGNSRPRGGCVVS